MWSFLTRYYDGRPEIDLFGKAEYILESCLNCDLIYQREILDEEGMMTLYEYYINSDVSLSIHERNPEPMDYEIQELRALSSRFGKRNDSMKVLDYGMGWGRWVRGAIEHGFIVSGTELSGKRKKYVHGLDVEIIDHEDLAESSFNLIHVNQVFEHLPEPLETLHNLSKLLSPDGVIHISVPPGNKTKKSVPKIDFHEHVVPPNMSPSMSVHPLEHINCFTQKSLLKMAELAGLKRIKIPLWKWRISFNPLKPKQSLLSFLRPMHRNYSPNCTSLYFTHSDDGFM